LPLSKVNWKAFTLSNDILQPSTFKVSLGFKTYPFLFCEIKPSPEITLTSSTPNTANTFLWVGLISWITNSDPSLASIQLSSYNFTELYEPFLPLIATLK